MEETRRVSSLRALRVLRGLTLDDVAREVGVSVAAVSYWERDMAYPEPANVESLCALFGVEVEELGLGPKPRRGRPMVSLLVAEPEKVAVA